MGHHSCILISNPHHTVALSEDNNSMHRTFRHLVCAVLVLCVHGHWLRMTLPCMFPWIRLCLSTRVNAVRHLLYTRYSKFSIFQSKSFVAQYILTEVFFSDLLHSVYLLWVM